MSKNENVFDAFGNLRSRIEKMFVGNSPVDQLIEMVKDAPSNRLRNFLLEGIPEDFPKCKTYLQGCQLEFFEAETEDWNNGENFFDCMPWSMKGLFAEIKVPVVKKAMGNSLTYHYGDCWVLYLYAESLEELAEQMEIWENYMEQKDIKDQENEKHEN